MSIGRPNAAGLSRGWRRLFRWRPGYIFAIIALGLILSLPSQQVKVYAQAVACGPFNDVLASDGFCPFILQAFNLGITNGTGANTFSPDSNVPRNQVVTFFDRVLDFSLHRGTIRTAINKTWTPTVTNGGVTTDLGAPINDIASDGVYYYFARNDGKVSKVSRGDRRIVDTYTLASGQPRKLGVFGGLLWIADDQGSLHVIDPRDAPGPGVDFVILPNVIPPGPFPQLAFDGANIWMGNNVTANYIYYPIGSPNFAGTTFPAATQAFVFDSKFMWVLLKNGQLLKLIPPTFPQVPTTQETLTVPGNISDCKGVYDGTNIWLPQGNSGSVVVVRPSPSFPALPSIIVKNEAIPNLSFPYAAAFDGETVMIAGLINSSVAIYKASDLSRIRTFSSGLVSIRGAASDGVTFTLGDSNSNKFVQY